MRVDKYYNTSDILKVCKYEVDLCSIGQMICTPKGALIYQAFLAQWLADNYGNEVSRPSLTEWLETASDEVKKQFWKDEKPQRAGSSVTVNGRRI